MKAWSESIDSSEVSYLVDFLAQEGLIANRIELTGSRSDGRFKGKEDYFEYQITPKGHAHLATLETKAVNSEQAFVAMWFDGAMKVVYEKAISLGIRDSGYVPFRIDRKDHNNKIDDEIIAEIRRSRFLVADFTQDHKGARGGVYYEAGFAHGLNIPVIFTCRADLMKELHFDTRQYNHIPWTPDNFEEFIHALSNRISATIGDGPLKKKVEEIDERVSRHHTPRGDRSGGRSGRCGAGEGKRTEISGRIANGESYRNRRVFLPREGTEGARPMVSRSSRRRPRSGGLRQAGLANRGGHDRVRAVQGRYDLFRRHEEPVDDQFQGPRH